MDEQQRTKILLVDDAENWRNTFVDILGDEFHVVPCSSYEEGNAAIQAHREPFSVAIIDIRLDEYDATNEQGLSLAKAIMNDCANTSIIVVTGHPSLKTMRDSFRNLEVFDYVQKVSENGVRFDPKHLRGTVRIAVDEFQWKQMNPLGDELSQLAADLVHGMNNAIGRIPQRIALTMALLKSNEQESIKVLHQLNEIMTDVQISRQEARKLLNPNFNKEDIDIQDLVSSVIGDIEPYTSPGINFSIVSNLGRAMVSAIRIQLVTALKHVIDNSVKAMGTEGEILVKLVEEPDKVNKFVRIDVADTGVGIVQEKEEDIFELGRSFSEGGMGYGLWRSKKIVEKLGGSIQLRRNTSEGSTFSILLPIAMNTSEIANYKP